jgi:hypothetical protein
MFSPINFLLSGTLPTKIEEGDYIMNDPIKKAYDIDSTRKEINERQQIINEYINTRHLDRYKAISKIMELRGKDAKVAAVTNIKLAQFSVPFSQAPDENIVAELKMQMDILSAELAKELSEQ